MKALFHDQIRDQFEYKIRNHYMDAAGRFEARRRVKVADNPNIRKSSESADSIPNEPSDSMWDSYEDSIYEGGFELKRKNTMNKQRLANLRKSKNMLKSKKKKKNRNKGIEEPIRVKGSGILTCFGCLPNLNFYYARAHQYLMRFIYFPLMH